MGSVENAISAKSFLEGKDMFQGCCHIRVGFSKRNQLIVKQNDHKSRDYTVPQMGQIGGGMGGFPGMMGGAGGNPMGGLPGFGQMPGMGGPGMGMQGGAMGMFGGAPGGGSSVVLINKLNADLITADILFTLFGIYGDVMRVKILFNKRDTAMLQFNTPQQAAFACQNLSGCPLHGQNILVTSSKHTDVKLPRDAEQAGANLTKDYSDSPNHRYKLGRGAPKNVNPPSQVLHIANLHSACTAAELVTLFQAQQPQSESLPVVEFFKTDRKMAYIGLCSVEAAVEAVLNLHNYSLGGWPIRVSFSPKSLDALTPSTE
mmetsp:Transcript_12618/g.18089  ORF Transcript_12618/g.18089 Transcript_12618/m.18089 type:complete len:316 (+) Transcript_12618:88-1035(+)